MHYFLLLILFISTSVFGSLEDGKRVRCNVLYGEKEYGLHIIPVQFHLSSERPVKNYSNDYYRLQSGGHFNSVTNTLTMNLIVNEQVIFENSEFHLKFSNQSRFMKLYFDLKESFTLDDITFEGSDRKQIINLVGFFCENINVNYY